MATWINLFDIIYPVGSIYHSTSSTSPASTVGGTWSAISGRFLLGANSSYPAGKQDGAASVTLSLSQIPAHSHQWKGWNWLQTSASSGDKALVVGSDIAGSTASAGGGLPTTICRHIMRFIFGDAPHSGALRGCFATEGEEQRSKMVGGVA